MTTFLKSTKEKSNESLDKSRKECSCAPHVTFLVISVMPAKMSSDARADLFKTEYNFIKSDSNDFKK
jgi:hypothetical protein